MVALEALPVLYERCPKDNLQFANLGRAEGKWLVLFYERCPKKNMQQTRAGAEGKWPEGTRVTNAIARNNLRAMLRITCNLET